MARLILNGTISEHSGEPRNESVTVMLDQIDDGSADLLFMFMDSDVVFQIHGIGEIDALRRYCEMVLDHHK